MTSMPKLTSPKRTPELRCYYSLRSPYGWLAMLRLDALGLGPGTRLAYLPYFEPTGSLRERLEARGAEFLYTPMSKARHRYILGDVKRLAQGQGLQVCWPVDIDVDWSIPHLVALACTSDAQRRTFLFDALDARWRRGEAIFDWNHSQQLLAARIGAAAAAAVIADARSDRVAEQAVNCLYEAWKADVFGVPTLSVGRERFWGHDRLDQFMLALERHDGTGAPDNTGGKTLILNPLIETQT